ncbi:DUF2851 family protein [Flavobacterium aquatile]|uniref:DUF2851 domain-containing protein n=1 Tax=Flavobacterium aquatile LMG 4008 = ATCC 11947 TaxID=1453498 RepID=A0A095V3T2_9FLAO|nr:DUF2851 family protein [Flavobacterium aquatile]KGD69525.1 hypothetical protein LG45_01805 [Flavobacterium aquatile LMG 4008 = ATCC 11947]OXA66021.1 hypothetical protein B0A61_12130 [Flavobacterium aquatile LMG 4008 = ATCC 11947]GEC77495.1 hypothetical protein FAQ01_03650 [Flavobacterium aquatile]
MKEDFIHYVWNYKKFDFSNLKTTQGENLVIVNSGQYLQKAGPDFFNAQIILENQKWAGNVEIHLKSSDWYLHHHEKDDNYNNVILHVVWDHDTPIFRKDNSEIPVLEIKNYVSKEELNNYLSLTTQKSWIFCENQVANIDEFVFSNWQERLFYERLERKIQPVNQLLEESENDWESLLFCMLAKNFGLNTNGESFLKMAKSITFSLIRKEALEVMYLEALFFGQADMIPIDVEDNYPKELKSWYDYIALKYKLSKPAIEPIQFFKHRPDNFPTIRLSQLAMLYHLHRNLFSKIIEANSIEEIYKIFNLSVSDYWKTHYNFDKASSKKEKSLSKSFIDLVIINTIIPVRFAYARAQGKEISETLTDLLSNIPSEKNSIIEKFTTFGIKSKNAFQSQSLLELKNEYCNHKKCLQCAVGLELLKNK